MKRAWWMGLVLLVACGGEDSGTEDGVVEDTAVDTADSTFVPFDSIDFDTATTVTATDTSTGTATDSGTATGSDVVADADADADISTGCSTFGCTCNGNNDCLDGLCIEAADGQICTRSCIAECPDGFDCVQSSAFGDPISLCVPRYTRLCRPCQSDNACQAAADPYPAYCVTADDAGNGSFCAASCAARECPEGYACEDVATSAGGTARQCVPTSGECTCRPTWSGFGFVTDCEVRNAFGECDGTRTCGPNGLTACTGPQASPELCDGDDNDCNGTPDDIPAVGCLVTNAYGSCPGTTACSGNSTACVGKEPAPETCNGADDNCNTSTDEGSCEDGLTCTADTCQNGSQCTHALNVGSCLINGACWAQAGFNPLNACELCDPSRSTVTWSQTANTCVIGGGCYPSGAVNPQNACQICNPNQSTASWTNSTNTCQIGGQCYLANDINPSNTCEICVPSTSAVTWTQAFNTCNIQGQCYAAGAKKSGEPCFVCDPSRSATSWSAAANNTTCDDGNACSPTSACNGAGLCVGDTSCNDGIACTQDTCGAGGCDNSQVATGYCRISGTCWTTGAANPQNGCQVCSAASKTAWSGQASSVGCSDGQYCTIDDHCNGSGACVGGTTRNCGDAYSCTTDTCNDTSDQCVNTLQGSRCIISGSCYSDGDAQSGNICNECEPTASTGAWTFMTNKSCNDANACTITDVCTGGGCSGSPKRDQNESNDTTATATGLGTYGDSSNYPQKTSSDSGFFPDGDVDWFSYVINDETGGDISPRVQVINIPSGQNPEVCVYLRCTVANATPSRLECDRDGRYAGGSITVGGQAYNGCCVNGSGDENMFFDWYYASFGDPVHYPFDCDGGDDSYRAYVRVRNTATTAGNACDFRYTLRIGDD